jgi:hypothetical protein
MLLEGRVGEKYISETLKFLFPIDEKLNYYLNVLLWCLTSLKILIGELFYDL